MKCENCGKEITEEMPSAFVEGKLLCEECFKSQTQQ